MASEFPVTVGLPPTRAFGAGHLPLGGRLLNGRVRISIGRLRDRRGGADAKNGVPTGVGPGSDAIPGQTDAGNIGPAGDSIIHFPFSIPHHPIAASMLTLMAGRTQTLVAVTLKLSSM